MWFEGWASLRASLELKNFLKPGKFRNNGEHTSSSTDPHTCTFLWNVLSSYTHFKSWLFSRLISIQLLVKVLCELVALPFMTVH